MTVKPVKKTLVSMDAVGFDRSVVGETMDVFPKVRMEEVALEADQESGGSSTEEAEAEVESPKSVAKFGRKKFGRFVHSQILRVKEEELLLKEDIDGEGCLNNKERKKSDCYQERHVNVIVFARPILPSSPLSGKSTTSTSLKAATH
ncbi:Integrin beta-like protein [Melia azedarach]|uniref:Integrin beta-like protein n=1 Tax=Melia azedarach TaxID=155640 RepID=A0ACC1X853_MELAZ|nr:Integrin beta-like protein [Melia azedarach]